MTINYCHEYNLLLRPMHFHNSPINSSWYLHQWNEC